MIPERWKIKVTEEDIQSMDTPFWSPRMIEILLAIYRWAFLVLLLVCGLVLATTWLGTVYFLTLALLAFTFIRRVSPVRWLLLQWKQRSIHAGRYQEGRYR